MVNCVGQQLGKYHLVRFLGKGGFGDVYLGKHVEDGTQAAIKVLHEPLTNENINEFVNEAGVCKLLNHESIVRLLDVGIRDNYIPFLAMEYAPNGSLANRYPHGTQLPLTIIISYVKPISSALQYAHDKGLIHRDVKPANFLIGANGSVLLGDFGIAAIALSTRSREKRYEKQKPMGTWNYAAPEQFIGKAVPASDQYSLAVVVYEWLCGDRPFHGDFYQLANQHHQNIPPSPLREKINISLAVEQVIMKALEKDPKKRYEAVQKFANALEQAFMSSQQITTLPPRTPAQPQRIEQTAPIQRQARTFTVPINTKTEPITSRHPQWQPAPSAPLVSRAKHNRYSGYRGQKLTRIMDSMVSFALGATGTIVILLINYFLFTAEGNQIAFTSGPGPGQRSNSIEVACGIEIIIFLLVYINSSENFGSPWGNLLWAGFWTEVVTGLLMGLLKVLGIPLTALDWQVLGIVFLATLAICLVSLVAFILRVRE